MKHNMYKFHEVNNGRQAMTKKIDGVDMSLEGDKYGHKETLYHLI